MRCMLKAFLGRATHNVLGEGYPRCLHRLSQAQACGVDAPKYDSHPPAAEDDNDGDAGEEGGGDGEGAARASAGGEGRAATQRPRCLHWINKPLQTDFDDGKDRQT